MIVERVEPTPGPWVALFPIGKPPQIVSKGDRNKIIVDRVGPYMNGAIAFRNANLLAAGPELLDALIELHQAAAQVIPDDRATTHAAELLAILHYRHL